MKKGNVGNKFVDDGFTGGGDGFTGGGGDGGFTGGGDGFTGGGDGFTGGGDGFTECEEFTGILIIDGHDVLLLATTAMGCPFESNGIFGEKIGCCCLSRIKGFHANTPP